MGELDDYVASLSGTAAGRSVSRGWQQSGELIVGGGQPVTMQAVFPEPNTYTVAFLQPFAFGNDSCVRAEALIMWNVNGTYKPVRVSLVGGMSVTAAASGVKVIMLDATPTNINGYCPAGTKYNVSCQVARGTRGFAAVAPYYIPQSLAVQTLLAKQTQLVVPVPFDAGMQSFLVSAVGPTLGGLNLNPPAAGDITVYMTAKSPNGNGTSSGLGAFDPTVFTSWYPCQPGCNEIVVLNTNGSHAFGVSVVFGVDG